MNSMKSKKYMILEDEPPRSEVLLGKNRGQLLIAPKRMKRLGQNGNEARSRMCLAVKVKSDAVKNNVT